MGFIKRQRWGLEQGGKVGKLAMAVSPFIRPIDIEIALLFDYINN